jgi:3-deoxy-7-phosphoheptulonate synthase
MLVVMSKGATPEQIDAVIAAIQGKGYTARPIPGGERMAIGILHNRGAVDASYFLGLPGVKDAIPVTRPYKLVSREFQPQVPSFRWAMSSSATNISPSSQVPVQ